MTCYLSSSEEVPDSGWPSPQATTRGEVWPHPQKAEYGKENRTIRRGSIMISWQGIRDVDCDILEFVKRTYQKDWFFPNRGPAASPGGLKLIIRSDAKCPEKDEYPQQGMNEEYYLRVPVAGDAVLEADEVWGILRGLESFSQLIFQTRGAYFVRTAIIHDWPEYTVRGIMIDTSRHYIPKKIILRQLDIMAQNKFNLLHWHIVDSQSFPYVSKKYPHLSERSAYSPSHVYNKNTVQEILDHAKMRGIRVMVEFDTPGHMASWKGELGLLTECHDTNGHSVMSNIIDPTLERNYAFLRNFYDEILSVFPEKFIHLGGDEVGFWKSCWLTNPKIRDFMLHKGFDENTTMLENYYYDRLQDLVTDIIGVDKDARMIFWEDVFQYNNPFPKAVAHIWYSASEKARNDALHRYTAAGHEVILSSCWQLNYVNYGSDWKDEGSKSGQFYYCDPRGFSGSEEQKKLVLGGIVGLWGEFIDGTNIESVLWPRASAVAERLWSNPKQTTDADRAWPRLHEHRCRLVARGYRASPINGPDFCINEYDDPTA
ncbi:unnamed protein product [Bursaphelenchus okinawaensis]|uniref:Beta-hexosaminidase n=1 Tax=Bursaphelenchus okinawaensis TaxID=465554 RepID=A0A811LN65_9BILA|nr:unnamed protein product [Bursaphelenchus okinawaensis]CAG9124367.1 unnamed protein product [Bursaphelenchus okinawaensis]